MKHWIGTVGALLLLPIASLGFTLSPLPTHTTSTSTSTTSFHTIRHHRHTHLYERSNSNNINSGYISPELSESISAKNKNKPPYPKVGDIVRYFRLDGGSSTGQEVIGKLTFLQKQTQASDSSSLSSSSSVEWLAEVTELENVGDGYFCEYPSRKRKSKQQYVNIRELAPLPASFVRTEDAYKVPMDGTGGRTLPTFTSYQIDGFGGPAAIPVNESVVLQDLELYSALKVSLLKNAALAGLVGTVLVELSSGFNTGLALDYFIGSLGGVGYLFFLSVKTDTVASSDSKFGSNVANVRFVVPLLVLILIATQNASMGIDSPVALAHVQGTSSTFDLVSKEQFAVSMLGFLTYRIPLFISQLGPVISDTTGLALPGSAGVAMQMAADAKKKQQELGMTMTSNSLFGNQQDLTTVLLVSGPTGTGKTSLVEQLIEQGEGKFVKPNWIDSVVDPVLMEQLQMKQEVLSTDSTGRYALTKDGIVNAIPKDVEGDNNNNKVVVIDASVNLAKKLTQVGGTRLVGVWIGLDSMDKFESRLAAQVEAGTLRIPADETAETVVRAKIREVVKDIEYGVVSGIFEFTILNDDFDQSLKQLQEAAQYCFK